MNVDGNILIVADLGQLKAYEVKEAPRKDASIKPTASLSLITDIDYIAAHQKEQDQLSDKQGTFKGASGEAHNRTAEQVKRLLKNIAEDITAILDKQAPKAWCLAFPKETHKELEALLGTNHKALLKKSVAADLTKTAKDKLLTHFE